MVRSDFNFDVWFVIYRFFCFNQCYMWLMSSTLFFLLHAYTPLQPSATCYCFVAEATGKTTRGWWRPLSKPVLANLNERNTISKPISHFILCYFSDLKKVTTDPVHVVNFNCAQLSNLLLRLFQNTLHSDFSRYNSFAMHLNIYYVHIHNKRNVCRKQE
jgi:hypothetical protein